MLETQKAITQPDLYGLSTDFQNLSADDRARVHMDNTWDDLWTNTQQYDEVVKAANSGFPVQGIYSRQGWLDNPIVPSPLVVFGWFDLLEKRDIPKNNLGWIIVSKRVLTVMQSLSIHPKTHALRVLERQQFGNVYGENVRLYEQDSGVMGVQHRDDWFFGLQLSTHSVTTDDWDAFDTRNVQWRALPDRLPAFFVDPKSPGELLVTGEGRAALEAAGIQGMRFTAPFQ